MSASTGAPAALARSEGHQLQANGTATPTPAAPLTAAVATIRLRRVLLIFSSLMEGLSREASEEGAILAGGSRNVHVFAPKSLKHKAKTRNPSISRITPGIPQLPGPAVAAHVIEPQSGAPAKLTSRERRISVAGRDVPGAAGVSCRTCEES